MLPLVVSSVIAGLSTAAIAADAAVIFPTVVNETDVPPLEILDELLLLNSTMSPVPVVVKASCKDTDPVA